MFKHNFYSFKSKKAIHFDQQKKKPPILVFNKKRDQLISLQSLDNWQI